MRAGGAEVGPAAHWAASRCKRDRQHRRHLAHHDAVGAVVVEQHRSVCKWEHMAVVSRFYIGGTVCGYHGGNAPAVKAKARYVWEWQVIG